MKPAVTRTTERAPGASTVSVVSTVPVCLVNPGDQIYTFVDADGWTYLWNATRGRRLAEQNHGDNLLIFAPHEHGITVEHVHSRYPDLDEAYARKTDLRQPLLFVPHRAQGSVTDSTNAIVERQLAPTSPTALLIDGWHRLLKALLTGVPELPAFMLTEEEATTILIQKMPPRAKQS